MLSIAVIKHNVQKQLVEEIWLHLPITVHQEGKSGQEPEVKIEAETMKGAYFLAPQGMLSFLSPTPQDHLPRGGTAISGLGFHISIINQENAHQVCLKARP